MKKALALLAFLLSSSAVYAQTQPAEMGITPTTAPEVLQTLDNTKTWVPIGTVDSTTHTFTPVGGGGGGGAPGGSAGSIQYNNGGVFGGYPNPLPIIRGGTGATSASGVIAGSNVTVTGTFPNQTVSATGGGGGSVAAGLSMYGAHAALVSGVTTATGPYTAMQQGFTAAGDGGAATYNWNATSYCNGGTSGTPVAADGVNCILPVGQVATTAGRYLLQSHGALDVRQVGMQQGGFDNAPVVPALMNALGTASFNGGTADVIFPGLINREYVAYYFSNEFMINRNAHYHCTGATEEANTVELVFAAGVDGVIQEDQVYTSDHGYGGGALSGCTIASLGYGYAPSVTAGSNAIAGVVMSQDPGGLLPASTWHVGDGVMSISGGMGGNPASAFPAVTTGAYVSAVSGANLTLASGFTVNSNIACCGVVVYQLPVALKFNIVSTVGNSTITVTGGPRLLRAGDLIWSDAFPFGTTVYQASGTVGAQTVVLSDPFITTLQVATKSHTSGAPGNLWVLPAGLKRDVLASSSGNHFIHWPVGLEMACSSGQVNTSGTGLLCTTSHDSYNYFEYDMVGRWVAGNNTGASDSTNEHYATNFLVDVFEGGTVGSTYINLNSNSVEGGNALYGVLGMCSGVSGGQNYSVFVGGYIVDNTGGCAQSPGVIPAVVGPWPLAVGPVFQAPTGAPTISPGSLLNAWTFIGSTAGCVGMNQTSPFILSASPTDCSTLSSVGIAWDAATGSFYWAFGSGGGVERWAGQGNYLGYSGSGNWSGPVFTGDGIQLGNNSQDFTGQERILDAGTGAPNDGWRLQGDIRLNQHPTPGGNMAWTNTPSATTTLSGNVTKGTTTSVAVAACPSPALPAGTPVIDLTGISSGGIALSRDLGTLNTCIGTTLTLQAAATNGGTSGDTIQFLQWRPAALIANDVAGSSWALGNTMRLIPVAIASLPTCNAGAAGSFAAVNNGAAPTYGGAVGTTGAVTAPVFCTGSGWTYH